MPFLSIWFWDTVGVAQGLGSIFTIFDTVSTRDLLNATASSTCSATGFFNEASPRHSLHYQPGRRCSQPRAGVFAARRTRSPEGLTDFLISFITASSSRGPLIQGLLASLGGLPSLRLDLTAPVSYLRGIGRPEDAAYNISNIPTCLPPLRLRQTSIRDPDRFKELCPCRGFRDSSDLAFVVTRIMGNGPFFCAFHDLSASTHFRHIR